MTNAERSTCDLLERWEDHREIRNIMGRYTQQILYKEELELFDYWSNREDVCLAVNDGWYLGADAIKSYYESFHKETLLGTEVLMKIFADEIEALPEEKRFGVGQFDVKPTSSDLIEIAEDRQTAKGMWTYQGSDVRMTEYGPLSYWTFGVYAVDFIREDGQWKMWHMQNFEDINRPCGEKWWEPPLEREKLVDFASMAGAGRPEPTIKEVNHVYFTPMRHGSKFPRCPEPFDTFADTFSYGKEA